MENLNVNLKNYFLNGQKITQNTSELVIPNVFGPYCKPHYNSVVSTFAYQLINNITPSVIEDNKLELVYVQNLVVEFDKITRLN